MLKLCRYLFRVWQCIQQASLDFRSATRNQSTYIAQMINMAWVSNCRINIISRVGHGILLHLHVKSTMVSLASKTVRTTAQIPVLGVVGRSALEKKDQIGMTYKHPSPMRQHVPTLIYFLIWTFHRKTMGRKARAKSQNADAADIFSTASSSLEEYSPPWNRPMSILILGFQQRPGIARSQSLCSGEHCDKIVTIGATLLVTVRAIITYRTRFAYSFVANRRYKKMLIESLVHVVEKTQGIWTIQFHFAAWTASAGARYIMCLPKP